MRGVEKDVKGVGGQIGQVVNAQFFQGVDKGAGEARGFYGKSVRLVFVAAGEHIHENGKNQFNRGVKHSEKDESCINGRVPHVKGVIKSFVCQKKGEQKENDTHVTDADKRAGQDMLFFVVPDFMGEDG